MAGGGHSSSRCAGLSPSRPLLLRSTGSRRAGSAIVAHGPSLLCGMWDLPRPGLEPVSPALAGRFSTAAPPGKPRESQFFKIIFINISIVFFNKFIYLLFLAALGLHCYLQAFSSCCEQGLLFVVVRGLLLLRSTGSRAWASVDVARGLSSCGLWALEHRLSSCGTRAQ